MIYGDIATDDGDGLASKSEENGNDEREERFSSQRAAAKSWKDGRRRDHGETATEVETKRIQVRNKDSSYICYMFNSNPSI